MELKPGYKQTEVGVIPEDWEVCPVERKGQVTAGKALAVNAPGEQRPYIRTKNVFDGRIDIDDVLTMPMTEEQFAQFQLRPGDVLLNEGQSLDLVGRCSIYKDEYPSPCAIQNALLRFRPKARTSASFASHLFRNCQKTGIFAKIALQTTSVAHLGSSRFASLRLAWPTTNEQIAIAAALDDIDHLIKSLDDLITKKRGIKHAAMQELLTGKRRLPGFEGEWVVKKLGDTATLKARIGWQGLTTAEYLDSGDFYLVTGTEIEKGRVSWHDCHYVDEARYKQDKFIQIKPRDVLVTKDGTIGKVALVTDIPGPATLNSGIFVIRPTENSFNPEFFYYLLCSRVFSEFLSQLAAGSTINHLYQKDFVSFSYRIPPANEEQAEIASTLNAIDCELTALETRFAKIRELKQGMMQELLTGRIRLL